MDLHCMKPNVHGNVDFMNIRPAGLLYQDALLRPRYEMCSGDYHQHSYWYDYAGLPHGHLLGLEFSHSVLVHMDGPSKAARSTALPQSQPPKISSLGS